MFKQKCGPKRKISQQNGRKIVRSVQKMINTSEKVTARKVLVENDVRVSKRTMQRYLSSKDFKYGNIKKQIFLTNNHKNKKKCKYYKNGLKTK